MSCFASLAALDFLHWLRDRRGRVTSEQLQGSTDGGQVVELHAVVLEVAESGKSQVLSNLLGLYMHDLSDTFPIRVGTDGSFRYEKLSLYWSEPGSHFPFLIYSGELLAGFALVTRGSPATDDPAHLDVAEFFVLRGYRRRGVGQQAAFLLWNRLPGQWVVRVSDANRAALPFWSTTVAQYTRGAFSESKRSGSPHGWHVLSFASSKLGAALNDAVDVD